MEPREPHEAHRAATPLELLFDLCFVVAVAQAAASLHHGLAEGHTAHALMGYGLVFFAIWWAWMNFTWFASAYATEDAPYRLMVLVQIAGALILAAGIPRAFERVDFGVVTLGYTILRVGLIANWLRAARSDPPRRQTTLRYALGLTVCQSGWLLLLTLPQERWILGWLVLAPAELLVPIWAERAHPTPWHAHHITERYGLFVIIVLGESVLAATAAVQEAIDTGEAVASLAGCIIGGLLIFFSLWWIYFDRPAHRFLFSNREGFVWGYGHFLIFASAAAIGAGLGVSVDFFTGHAHLPGWAPGLSVGVPVAVFVLCVYRLVVRPLERGPVPTAAFVGAAVLVLLAASSTWAVLLIGLILAALVAVVIGLDEARRGTL
jgi:low temperature requirement protein LtrA